MALKNRNTQLSVAKGIGIILMVIGHSGCPQVVRHFIYMFHMPLFFVAAGYFMKPQDSVKSYGKFCLKRIKKLYFPYIKWGLFFLLLHNVFYSLGFYSDSYSSKDFLWHGSHMICQMEKHEELFGPGWFLKDLLLGSIIVSAVLSLCRGRLKNNILVILVISFLSASIASRYFGVFIPYLEMDLSRLLFDCTFILVGVLIGGLSLDYKSKLLMIGSLAIMIVCMLLVSPQIEILKYSFQEQIPYFVGAVSGCVFVLSLSKIIEKSKVLTYLGDHTLIVLALHFLAFKLVTSLFVQIWSLPSELMVSCPVIEQTYIPSCSWLIYALVGVILPIVIILCYEYLVNRLCTKRFSQ